MKIRLLNIWRSVRTSFWFVPGLIVLSSIGLSFIMTTIDRRIELDSYDVFGLLYTGGPDGARSILATIAGSMITVAGVTFSITIVSLTLAASQFGGRLLRNFMRDTGNQVVLGTFLATFIYCLLILRTVHTVEGHIFVPNVSVTFAIFLALTNVGVLIYFIHHVSTSIQADRMIMDVYYELLERIHGLLPEKSKGESSENDHERKLPHTRKNLFLKSDPIAASHDGYLQAVDIEGLLEIAGKNDFLIDLQYRPGDFVVAGSELATIMCNKPPDKNLSGQIVKSFILGPQRTPEQDAEFAIHQLVEIALRALSPGINDPYTAISCVDRLGSALCHLTDRAFPPVYRYDDQGKLRIMTKPVTFTGITNAAFDQIRQHGRSNVALTIRLLETLRMIAGYARTSEQQRAILRQAGMIVRASRESLPEKNDREDVQERYQVLLDLFEKKTES